MFDDLAAAVDGLEIPVDGGALIEAFSIRDRLDARIMVAAADFDRAELWDLDGDTSMAAWLRHHAGREAGAATNLTVRARKLAALPVLRDAFLAGALSGGQVDTILANVPLRHLDLFAAHEAALVEPLAGLDLDALRAAMADWRAKADATADEEPDPDHENEVFFSTTIDGRGDLRGSLNADLTALVDAAFRIADPKDFELTPAERRADALETIVRHFLDHQQTHTGGRHRPHVNVALTYEEFCEGIGGTYPDTGGVPSPAQLGALLCDCATHRLLVKGRSAILDYGRAKRLVPADLPGTTAPLRRQLDRRRSPRPVLPAHGHRRPRALRPVAGRLAGPGRLRGRAGRRLGDRPSSCARLISSPGAPGPWHGVASPCRP